MLTLLIQFIFYICTVSADPVDTVFSISVQLVLTLLIQFIFYFCTVNADPVDTVYFLFLYS